jgi:hypothetical protein
VIASAKAREANMLATITLTADELQRLTGRCRAPAQLRALHAMGFWLARRTPFGVALPREHYLAVCQGAQQHQAAPTVDALPMPNIGAGLAARRQHARL